ncbi:hypothetical protein NKI01_24995 [Mesorhizobium sp. M0815]|uniref:hypothetical protein n=1 Tax=unclassified Mesorhizobium TaxID=325217 RepID=UPI003339CB1E
MKGEVPVIQASWPTRNLCFAASCWCKFQIRRPVNATIKVNPGEGGMCVTLDTSGAAFAADLALIIGLHDDDNSVRR